MTGDDFSNLLGVRSKVLRVVRFSPEGCVRPQAGVNPCILVDDEWNPDGVTEERL